jgi:hypothetical protein
MGKQDSRPSFLWAISPAAPVRFLIAALKQVKDGVLDTLGKSDEEKRWWLSQMKHYSLLVPTRPWIVDHGSSEHAVFGDGHSQLLRVDDSILDGLSTS